VALRGDQRDRPSPREHRAFAPGNGRDRNGPDDGARPRGPGSEQPPRETATGVGGETRFTVPGVKGEEARYAVKGTASDGRTRDAHPRCRRAPSLSAGETLRRAESSVVGRPVSRREETRRTPGSAAGRNRPARSERNKPPRWCKTTRAARGRDRPSLPERSRGDASPGRRTLRLRTMEGRSLETPREAVRPAGRTAWIGTRRESRRQGQEGRARTSEACGAPDRRDLEGHGVDHRRPRRGAAKPIAAETIGELPPWTAPDGRSERRETARRARAQPLRRRGM